jgi:hypothetical protein
VTLFRGPGFATPLSPVKLFSTRIASDSPSFIGSFSIHGSFVSRQSNHFALWVLCFSGSATACGVIEEVPFAHSRRRVDFAGDSAMTVAIAWGDLATAYDIAGSLRASAADKASQDEARRVVERWNAALAAGRGTLWSPTIRGDPVAPEKVNNERRNSTDSYSL